MCFLPLKWFVSTSMLLIIPGWPRRNTAHSQPGTCRIPCWSTCREETLNTWVLKLSTHLCLWTRRPQRIKFRKRIILQKREKLRKKYVKIEQYILNPPSTRYVPSMYQVYSNLQLFGSVQSASGFPSISHVGSSAKTCKHTKFRRSGPKL